MSTNLIADQRAFMKACDQQIYNTLALGGLGALLYSELIREEYAELTRGFENKDPVEIADGCIDLMYVIIGYLHSAGFPVQALWDEVQRSNMAKVDPVTGKVTRRADGKILKPSGWTPPDLASTILLSKGG